MTGHSFHHEYLYYITKTTKGHNVDNISRTKAYFDFYLNHPEIKWAFVASMVSRNAGWNMTDLTLPFYKNLLSEKEQKDLFMTYERANWLIFSDAYPQLLIYSLSKQLGKPMFHLLKNFHISQFIYDEWERFWYTNQKDRLLTSLIINEQHVIHSPVINQSYFHRHVFMSLPYILQNFFLMNAVLLPTRSKNLYGAFVHRFTKVQNRIRLGKTIATILFQPNVFEEVFDFAFHVEHTGSRKDYEKYHQIILPKSKVLRLLFPKITHHDHIRYDWYKKGRLKKDWFSPVQMPENPQIGPAFYKKRQLLYAYYYIKQILFQ